MSGFRKSQLSIAAAILALLQYNPAQAQGESITLRVPVQMKEMVATGVKVDCEIYGDGGTNIAKEFNTEENLFPIVNGEFDQVVEMVMTPLKPGGFIGAKSYRCTIKVLANIANTYHGTHTTPEVGSPSSGAPVFKLARPDRFFRASVTGPLAGTPLAGAKGLKQAPEAPVDAPKPVQAAPKSLQQ